MTFTGKVVNGLGDRVTMPTTGAVRLTMTKWILVLAAAMGASVVLSACGSSGVAVRGPGSIVFVAGAQVAGVGAGNTELVATTPGGGVRDLTSSPASEYGASWSPDGSRVVFFRRPATRGKGAAEEQPGIYVWSPGHGTPQRIASCLFYCRRYNFTWSPDNRQIAFLAEAGPTVIKVMNADGSGVHTVCDATRCGQGVGEPTWSPDGRRLVFNISGGWPSREGAPPGAIWIANADGSGVEQLTQPNCNVAGALGPDARGCAIDSGPVWSPNGRLIAFARSNARIPYLPHATGPARLPGIEVMRADGSHLHRISTCRGNGESWCYLHLPIAWAPDSKAIAYTPVTSYHPSSFRITTLAGKTTTIRTCVGRGCPTPFQLTWSPNGKRLAFVSRKGGTPSVWVIGRDGDGLHRVSRGGLCCLAWVRNGALSD